MKKAQGKRLDVGKTRILREICGATKLDWIKNERNRGTMTAGEIFEKMQEKVVKVDIMYTTGQQHRPT